MIADIILGVYLRRMIPKLHHAYATILWEVIEALSVIDLGSRRAQHDITWAPKSKDASGTTRP